jgi:hypothetical protein
MKRLSDWGAEMLALSPQIRNVCPTRMGHMQYCCIRGTVGREDAFQI